MSCCAVIYKDCKLGDQVALMYSNNDSFFRRYVYIGLFSDKVQGWLILISLFHLMQKVINQPFNNTTGILFNKH